MEIQELFVKNMLSRHALYAFWTFPCPNIQGIHWIGLKQMPNRTCGENGPKTGITQQQRTNRTPPEHPPNTRRTPAEHLPNTYHDVSSRKDQKTSKQDPARPPPEHPPNTRRTPLEHLQKMSRNMTLRTWHLFVFLLFWIDFRPKLDVTVPQPISMRFDLF